MRFTEKKGQSAGWSSGMWAE